MKKINQKFRILSMLIFLTMFSGTFAQTEPCVNKTFEEIDGVVAVEAEDFIRQTETSVREWFIIGNGTATPTPDPDGSHASSASGGKYIELLPDTRVNHGNPLISGVNFSGTPGVAGVLDYRIKFNSPGRYFVWVRAYSTGTEDNGLHVGLNGTWPESGKRMQWCEGKNTWRWDSKQRTNAVHCGVPQRIFLDIPSAGIHTVSFSMREDGFEMDKFILSQTYTRPSGAGVAPVAVVCNTPNPPAGNQFFVVNRQTGKKLRPLSGADGVTLIQVDKNANGNLVRWEQVNTDNGYFYIRNVATGKYFRPANDANGSALQQRPTNFSGFYTQWKKVNSSNGYFYLENRQTKLYFRPVGDGNNSPMVQRPTNYTGFYTQWKFQTTSSKSLNEASSVTELSASPNPASDHVLITGTADATGVSVYGLDGRKLPSTVSVESENSILVVFDESLSSGIYIVKTEDGRFVKVIKK